MTERKHKTNCLPFGCNYLSPNSLNKNKLLLYNSGNKVVFKEELITDEMKYIIKHMLKGDYDLSEEIELLDDIEQILLNKLLEISKIDNIFTIRGYHQDHTKNKLISKFNIMKSEILLGNDSPELFNDFKQLLEVLHTKKMITLSELKKLRLLITNVIKE